MPQFYDDVTDFEIWFHKNTKILLSQERSIFSSYKKNSLITHQALLCDKE